MGGTQSLGRRNQPRERELLDLPNAIWADKIIATRLMMAEEDPCGERSNPRVEREEAFVIASRVPKSEYNERKTRILINFI